MKLSSMRLKAPCKNCPFRKDMDFLHINRKIELTYALGWQQQGFNCHKTLDYDSGEGEFVPGRSNHCAGAMLYLQHIEHPNLVMQLGARLGVWSADELQGAESIHDTIDGFIGDDRFQTMRDVVRHVERRA